MKTKRGKRKVAKLTKITQDKKNTTNNKQQKIINHAKTKQINNKT